MAESLGISGSQTASAFDFIISQSTVDLNVLFLKSHPFVHLRGVADKLEVT